MKTGFLFLKAFSAMLTAVSSRCIALLLVLVLGVGCSSETESNYLSRDSTSTEARIDNLEHRVNSLEESQTERLGGRGFFIVLVGFAIVVGAVLLLWKRASNRKRDLGGLKHDVRDLQKKVRDLRKPGSIRSKEPDQNSSRSKEKMSVKGNEAFRRLESAVIELKDKVNRLQDRLEEKGRTGTEQKEVSNKDQSQRNTGRTKTSVAQRQSMEDEGESAGAETRSPDSNGPRRKRGEKSGRTPKKQGAPADSDHRRDFSLEEDYNQILNDSLSEREFKDRYDAIPLGIANEQERLASDQAPVVLQEDERGRYQAVEKSGGYFVFPKPGVTLKDSIRRQAGFDEVFQCGHFEHNTYYEVDRLDRAARFVQNRNGTFDLNKAGKVKLRRYG